MLVSTFENWYRFCIVGYILGRDFSWQRMTNHLQDSSFMSWVCCFPLEQEHIFPEPLRNMSFVAECIILLKLQDEHNVTTLLGVSLSLIHQAEQHFLICRKSTICEPVVSIYKVPFKAEGWHISSFKSVFFNLLLSLPSLHFLIPGSLCINNTFQWFLSWVVQYSVISLVGISNSGFQFSSVVFTFQLLTPEIRPAFHTLKVASHRAVAVGD